ncbi:MAG: ABC transporter ATP-binding protein [Candidatus Bathyarchaeia archaeon]
MLLQIKDLTVEVAGRDVLHDVNLDIGPGEIHALFGPNGAGKTSLFMAIVGLEDYKVKKGRILFKGKDLSGMPVYERVKLGIGLFFQRPPAIRGLKLRQLLEICCGEKVDIDKLAFELGMADFLDRDVNYGFSGGEIRRAELLQILALQPDLALLDEPESGVDLENIALVGRGINRLLERGIPCKDKETRAQRSAIIISHTGYILDYVDADRGHVLYNGTIVCSEKPRKILETIRKYGYEECMRCLLRT